MNDLTTSDIDRQNILNNRHALVRVQEEVGIMGYLFEGEYRYTKKMVADFYEVDASTIDRYLSNHAEELGHNGYLFMPRQTAEGF